jgi:ech hydrogenase subunit A
LIIFHAISKSLLFMAVGTAEHHISSRDIENMHGLINRMPRVAAMMVIGIAGMFLAPFGMLISKWVAIRAFIDAPFGFVFVIILAFGSAITVFFWAKWMGKIISVTPDRENIEGKVDRSEWIALVTVAGLSIITCFIFPLISTFLVEPFLLRNYGQAAQLGQYNIIIMIMMLVLLVVLPLSVLLPHKRHKHVMPYMGGRQTTPDMHFSGSLGLQRQMELSNYYLENIFGEKKLKPLGIYLCTVFIAVMLVGAFATGVFL